MTFVIRIARTPSVIPEAPGSFFEGLIQIDEWRETFWASAVEWGHETYVDQWRQGLRRACDERKPSALVTSFSGQDLGEAAVWWPMVLGQLEAILWEEHRLPLLQNKPPLTPDNWIEQLPTTRPMSVDGHSVSEWSVPILDLVSALSKNDFYL